MVSFRLNDRDRSNNRFISPKASNSVKRQTTMMSQRKCLHALTILVIPSKECWSPIGSYKPLWGLFGLSVLCHHFCNHSKVKGKLKCNNNKSRGYPHILSASQVSRMESSILCHLVLPPTLSLYIFSLLLFKSFIYLEVRDREICLMLVHGQSSCNGQG